MQVGRKNGETELLTVPVSVKAPCANIEFDRSLDFGTLRRPYLTMPSRFLGLPMRRVACCHYPTAAVGCRSGRGSRSGRKVSLPLQCIASAVPAATLS